MKITLYLISFLFLISAYAQESGQKLESYAAEEIKNNSIVIGQSCFDECKPRRKFKGILGPKQAGLERPLCLGCLIDHPEVYTVSEEYLKDEIVSEGKACFEECKPRRKFLGVLGSKQVGFERGSCLPCLKDHPELYTINSAYSGNQSPGSLKCDLSNDQQTVNCDNGEVYKKDNSVSNIERNLKKEKNTTNPSNSKPNGTRQ